MHQAVKVGGVLRDKPYTLYGPLYVDTNKMKILDCLVDSWKFKLNGYISQVQSWTLVVLLLIFKHCWHLVRPSGIQAVRFLPV